MSDKIEELIEKEDIVVINNIIAGVDIRHCQNVNLRKNQLEIELSILLITICDESYFDSVPHLTRNENAEVDVATILENKMVIFKMIAKDIISNGSSAKKSKGIIEKAKYLRQQLSKTTILNNFNLLDEYDGDVLIIE